LVGIEIPMVCPPPDAGFAEEDWVSADSVAASLDAEDVLSSFAADEADDEDPEDDDDPLVAAVDPHPANRDAAIAVQSSVLTILFFIF
jgi:hypothetical protein